LQVILIDSMGLAPEVKGWVVRRSGQRRGQRAALAISWAKMVGR